MKWEFENDRPIYVQLVEQLKFGIISGLLSKGSQLPSIRDLAKEAQVNPNTVVKALGELEGIGLIHTKRTSGKFVTDDVKLIQSFKEDLALETSRRYLASMERLGVKRKDAIKYLGKDE